MALATTFRSALRYTGFCVQTAKGTAAAAPSLYIPSVMSQCKWKWNANMQEEKYSTGDLFVLVDGIPTKPMASGTLVCPFKPSVLNSFYAACCYANGDVLAPVWITFFLGDGFKEKIFVDVLCTQSKMNVADDEAPALWTMSFLGIAPPITHVVRTVTLPAYERSFRLKDLVSSTILGTAGINGMESMQWTIDAGTTAYYGSRGDGGDGPSDLIINELNVTVDGTLAYNSDILRAAIVNACGAPGSCIFELDSTCGTEHTHTLALPNGLTWDEETNAPDNAVIDETFTLRGLRQTSGTGAVATIAIT